MSTGMGIAPKKRLLDVNGNVIEMPGMSEADVAGIDMPGAVEPGAWGKGGAAGDTGDGVAAVAGLAGGFMKESGNEGVAVAGGAMQGAAMGWQVGNTFNPVVGAIGAGVGAIGGAWMENKGQKDEANQKLAEENAQVRGSAQRRLAAAKQQLLDNQGGL